jgi:hypothetical protein
MHRIASVGLIAVTAYFLIATSAERCRSTAETVTVTSRTTCGPDTVVTVALDSSCGVTVLGAADAGLANAGTIGVNNGGGLLEQNVALYQQLPDDAGYVGSESCGLAPDDAGTGWAVTCNVTQCADMDAGCGSVCSGTLTTK